jgi:hypothetical protein
MQNTSSSVDTVMKAIALAIAARLLLAFWEQHGSSMAEGEGAGTGEGEGAGAPGVEAAALRTQS